MIKIGRRIKVNKEVNERPCLLAFYRLEFNRNSRITLPCGENRGEGGESSSSIEDDLALDASKAERQKRDIHECNEF